MTGTRAARGVRDVDAAAPPSDSRGIARRCDCRRTGRRWNGWTSGRKTRDEAGSAIRHLRRYTATTEPWAARENERLDERFAPLAEALGRELNDVATDVLQRGHASMALAFAFEESATVSWNNEGETLVDVYLAQRR